MVERTTIFSPFSHPEGKYPSPQLSLDDQRKLERAQAFLKENEKIAPYLSSEIIRQGYYWFAQVLASIFEEHGEENVVVLFNLQGGQWPYEGIKKAAASLDQPLHLNEHNSFPVRVSRSAGEKGFGELNGDKLQWVEPGKLQGKVVISVDDIGDRGLTQKIIKDLAQKDGAQRIITVNLAEKIRDDLDHGKDLEPDYVLFAVAYLFFIGGGMDDGTTNPDREFAFRDLDFLAVLIETFEGVERSVHTDAAA